MAATTAYTLRSCEAPPPDLQIEPALPGVLYEGPHGPVYCDAADGRIRVSGAVAVEFAASELEMQRQIEGAGMTVTVDGRTLLMRTRRGELGREGRAIVVFDGDREVVRFRLRRYSTVSMERPDGSVVGEVPSPDRTWAIAADAEPFEVGLLISFARSLLGLSLPWDGLPAPREPTGGETRAVDERRARVREHARDRGRIYNRTTVWVSALLMAFLTGLCAVGALVALPTAVRVVFALAGVVPAVLFVRLSMAGVYVGDDGVLIRDTWRSRRLAWAQIDRFEGRVFGAVAHHSDGRTTTIFAVGGGEWADQEGLLDELNRRLSVATGRNIENP